MLKITVHDLEEGHTFTHQVPTEGAALAYLRDHFYREMLGHGLLDGVEAINAEGFSEVSVEVVPPRPQTVSDRQGDPWDDAKDARGRRER